MTVKEFLGKTAGLTRIDFTDTEGFILESNANAFSVLPFLDYEISSFCFDRDESTRDGIRIILRVFMPSGKRN